MTRPQVAATATILLTLLQGAGCKSSKAPTPDAGSNQRLVDAQIPGDALITPLAVDFTISNCPRFEEGPRCVGRAPLTLEFVPLGTASVTRYLWDFGDGTPKSSARAPIHTYAFPGTYDVTLVGAGVAGSAPREHQRFVTVIANGAGDPCDVDEQCNAGLHCLCGSRDRAKCGPAFLRGLCGSSCERAPCQAPQVCADLSLPAGMTATTPWQEPLCLRACQTDDECGPGLRCRDLPALTPPGSWLRGCFPLASSPPGGPCRNPSGQLRNDACLTGLCLDVGANGLCSLDCSTAACPPGASCATMTDGRQLCLPRCGPDFACDRDPLLACTAPNDGPLGFIIPGTTGGTYCAPKPCTRHEDCGAAGLCRDDHNGAHCIRRVE